MSWFRGSINYEKFKSLNIYANSIPMKGYVSILNHNDYDWYEWLADWMHCLFWVPPCCSRYAAKFLAEVDECYKYLYVMYMEIMHARMFGSKIWSMCISAYSIFMHDYVQDWKRITKTCKGTYRVSTS